MPTDLVFSSFLQASTLTHASATLNSWTSVGSIGCRSCTTCAPRSAPRPAAPTRRATRSQRTRAACPRTASRGSFWDSGPAVDQTIFSLSLCSAETNLAEPKRLHRLSHKKTNVVAVCNTHNVNIPTVFLHTIVGNFIFHV